MSISHSRPRSPYLSFNRSKTSPFTLSRSLLRSPRSRRNFRPIRTRSSFLPLYRTRTKFSLYAFRPSDPFHLQPMASVNFQSTYSNPNLRRLKIHLPSRALIIPSALFCPLKHKRHYSLWI